MDLGGNRRGVDMGPYAVRASALYARLTALGHAVTDAGNVPVPVPEEIPVDPVRGRVLPSGSTHAANAAIDGRRVAEEESLLYTSTVGD